MRALLLPPCYFPFRSLFPYAPNHALYALLGPLRPPLPSTPSLHLVYPHPLTLPLYSTTHPSSLLKHSPPLPLIKN
ncbi:hypothetical protein K523DRAFT_320428 [Schizophyllum commune Tattone D]|nr:hypothetical protein K523DRAFT_320428 [Schizophyllum commune Tattone D]